MIGSRYRLDARSHGPPHGIQRRPIGEWKPFNNPLEPEAPLHLHVATRARLKVGRAAGHVELPVAGTIHDID